MYIFHVLRDGILVIFQHSNLKCHANYIFKYIII